MNALTWQDYADLGYDTLPLTPGTKDAFIPNWPQLSPAEMWERAPTDSNIGLRCGGELRFSVLDADDKDNPQTSGNVVCWLAGLGYTPDEYPLVTTPTNGRHFYLTLAGTLSGHWRELAADFGAGEFRYGSGAYVGAVPSVVKGSAYRLIGGDLRQLPRLDVKDVLPLLKNKSTTPKDAVSYAPISDKGWELLRGQGIDRYPSRSEAEQALACSLASTGHDFESVLRLFLTYPAAGKFAELHAADWQNAIRWLRLTCEKARQFTAADSSARQLARQALAWANSRPWPGRTGSTDHAVFLAHATIAERTGRATYGASIRELAELAGVHCDTAANATRRLLAAHRVLLETPATVSRPNVYRLCDVQVSDIHSPSTVKECPKLAHDAFRARGWKSVAEILTALWEQGPQTVSELAERTGRQRRTVREALNRMARIVDAVTGEEVSLVVSEGKKWRAVLGVDLDHVARLLGTAGKGKREQERHAEERRRHRRALALGRHRENLFLPVLCETLPSIS